MTVELPWVPANKNLQHSPGPFNFWEYRLQNKNFSRPEYTYPEVQHNNFQVTFWIIHTGPSCHTWWHVLIRPCPSLMANGSAWIFDMLYQTWEFNQILHLLNSWTAFKKFARSPGFDVLTLTRHKEDLPIPDLSKLGNSYRQTVEKQFARDQLISSWHPCTNMPET